MPPNCPAARLSRSASTLAVFVHSFVLSANPPVIPMDTQFDASAVLDEKGQIVPENFAAEADERIAGGVGPVRCGDNLAHHGRVRASKAFDLLVHFIKAARALALSFHRRVIMPESRKAAQLPQRGVRV